MEQDLMNELTKLREEKKNNQYLKQLCQLYTDHSLLQSKYNELKQIIDGTVGKPILPIPSAIEVIESDSIY